VGIYKAAIVMTSRKKIHQNRELFSGLHFLH